MLFCDVSKGEVVPYYGVPIERAASVEYVKKAIALDSSDPVKNLLFFFRYLDDSDWAVAHDAFAEVSSVDDPHIGAAGRKLDAGKIRRWLEDPKTPQVRAGLYAKLLAAAGKPKDAGILLSILEDRNRESGTRLDMILVAYTMLAPKDGWAYTLAILGNPGEDFERRYAAFSALRYHTESRSGVVTNRQITAVYLLLLGQADLADPAIEDLRRSERWDLADKVLAVEKTKVYDQPIVKRSMLRFALQCKDNAAAKAFVAARRKADPEDVADAQKLLDWETPPAPATADAKKPAESPKK